MLGIYFGIGSLISMGSYCYLTILETDGHLSREEEMTLWTIRNQPIVGAFSLTALAVLWPVVVLSALGSMAAQLKHHLRAYVRARSIRRLQRSHATSQ
jgi:Ni/Fe-hydrogenase subunit HybB-like protein